MVEQLYKSTIKKPIAPGAAPTPVTQAFQTPTDATAIKPAVDTAKLGYQAPTVPAFNARNVNQGLLQYDSSNSAALPLDKAGVDTSNMGVNVKATPEYNSGGSFLSDGAMVENRVKGLLDPENDLNKQVLGQTAAAMQGRGMVNSSIRATAGQTAMMDKALQIATPDAGTVAQADLTRQGATYASQQANQNTENTGSLNQQQTGLTGELNSQQAGYQQDDRKLQGAITGDLNAQEGNIAGAANTQAAQYQQDAAVTQGLLEGAGKTQAANIQAEMAGMESISSQNLAILQDKLQNSRLTTDAQNTAIMEQFKAVQTAQNNTLNNEYARVTAEANLNGSERQALGGFMQKMAADYEISVQNVLLDPNLDAAAKDAATLRINKIFNQDMANISKIFGVTYVNTTV